MDRDLQTQYNFRSVGQTNANEPSLASSTSISSSEQLNASKTSSMMTSQLQPNGAPTSQMTAFLSSAPSNEPRPMWGQNQQPMAGAHNLSVMQSSQSLEHRPASESTTEAYPHAENNNNLGGPSATAPFLRDFTLVAEAVKRVQMEVVMNEMESIRL